MQRFTTKRNTCLIVLTKECIIQHREISLRTCILTTNKKKEENQYLHLTDSFVLLMKKKASELYAELKERGNHYITLLLNYIIQLQSMK